MTPKHQMFERHFSPRTLAELWGYDDDTIRDWFADVEGVLRTGTKPGRGNRPRISMRIPESIAMKVYAERTR
jgi:hypothetical protein